MICYFCYPRQVIFNLVITMRNQERVVPTELFEYAEDSNWFKFWLYGQYQYPYSMSDYVGFDSSFVEDLIKKLNFDKYDYIIVYGKQIKKLKYSPLLSNRNDNLYFEKKVPIIPDFHRMRNDSIYIYSIKSNDKFRAPGP